MYFDDYYSSGDEDESEYYHDSCYMGCAEMFMEWMQDQYELSRKRKLSTWLASKKPEVKTAYHLKQNIQTAAQCGSVSAVKKYIKAGAKVDKFHKDGTLLHYAVEGGNPELIPVLLENGASGLLNYAAADGRSPLQWAVAAGDLPMVKALLDAKADIQIVSKKDLSKRTVLHEAVIRCNEELIQLLLDYGADLYATTSKGENVLSYAVRNLVNHKKVYLNILEFLISRGAKVLKDGRNQENLALHTVLKAGTLQALMLFNHHGVNLKELRNEPLLHSAVENRQHIEMMKYLLDSDFVDVDQEDLCCRTALHQAVLEATPVCIGQLLRYGANPNSLDVFEQTPLYLAVANGKQEAVKLLLEHDADIYTDTCSGLLSLAEQESKEFSQSPYDAIGRLLIKQIALIESQGRQVDPEDLELIEKYPKELRYFQTCKDELATMKDSYIFNTFTFHNVLASGNIYNCIGTKQAVKAFKSLKEVTEKFPIYGGQMHRRFARLRQKLRSMRKAMNNLNNLLPFDVHVFQSISYNILSRLRLRDIENLKKVEA